MARNQAKDHALVIEMKDSTLFLIGSLNELTCSEAVEKTIQEFLKSSAAEEFVVDLSRFVHANSVGLRIWMTVTENLNLTGWYDNVPEWFVHQINYLTALTNNGSILIRSFEAPFFQADTKAIRFEMVTVGKHIPLLENYQGCKVLPPGASSSCEPDFEPEEYLRFITENLSRYRQRMPMPKS